MKTYSIVRATGYNTVWHLVDITTRQGFAVDDLTALCGKSPVHGWNEEWPDDGHHQPECERCIARAARQGRGAH
jgi:hypothetical protein